MVTNIKKYNIFILFEVFSRNITEVFSSVLLYKMGYSIREILLFYIILYLIGALTSVLTIYIIKYLKPKYLLIISSILFSVSFYFMTIMNKTFINLVIFSIIYGISSYMYHTIRHYLAIKTINNHNIIEIGGILIYTNIAIILSSLLTTFIDKLSVIVVTIIIIVMSLIGILFIFKFNFEEDKEKIILPKIEKNKLKFFILEQNKVINLSFISLYLYLYVNNRISYVGICNIIFGISSIIFIYYFVRKINSYKYFKYLNIIFSLLLLLKLVINNKYLILVITFFESIGIKMFEVVSTDNMYSINKNTNIKGYLIKVELIFCLVRCIICIIGYLINNIKVFLYLTIVPIFLLSFIKRKNVNN